MVKGDHPELDDYPELNEYGIKLYQSLIGALQWAVTLGRFDIQCGVATLSRFRCAPREKMPNEAPDKRCVMRHLHLLWCLDLSQQRSRLLIC